jgi:hypothetical protein
MAGEIFFQDLIRQNSKRTSVEEWNVDQCVRRFLYVASCAFKITKLQLPLIGQCFSIGMSVLRPHSTRDQQYNIRNEAAVRRDKLLIFSLRLSTCGPTLYHARGWTCLPVLSQCFYSGTAADCCTKHYQAEMDPKLPLTTTPTRFSVLFR